MMMWHLALVLELCSLRRAPPCSRSCRAHVHAVRAALWRPLEDAAPGTGLQLGMASAPRLPQAAQRHQAQAGCSRQRLCAGQRGLGERTLPGRSDKAGTMSGRSSTAMGGEGRDRRTVSPLQARPATLLVVLLACRARHPAAHHTPATSEGAMQWSHGTQFKNSGQSTSTQNLEFADASSVRKVIQLPAAV